MHYFLKVMSIKDMQPRLQRRENSTNRDLGARFKLYKYGSNQMPHPLTHFNIAIVRRMFQAYISPENTLRVEIAVEGGTN